MPHIPRFITRKSGLRSLIFALAWSALGSPAAFAQSASTLTGVVRNAVGEPAAGAFVKIRSGEWSVSYMVVTQAGGRYTSPSLEPGDYVVQAFGDGYASKPQGPVQVRKGEATAADVVMNDAQKMYSPPKRFTEGDYEAMMPIAEAKNLLLDNCRVCHSAANFVSARHNREGWENTVALMGYFLNSNVPLQQKYNSSSGAHAASLSERELGEIVDYLSANFGPDTPPVEPQPRDANRNLSAESYKGSNFASMALDVQYNGGTVHVGAIAFDPAGNLWVSEKGSNALGLLNTSTLKYTRIVSPPGRYRENMFGAVKVDPNGNVWFTSNDGYDAKWFVYDPRVKKVVDSYNVPGPNHPTSDVLFATLIFPPNKTVWSVSSASDRLIKLDLATRKSSNFPLREATHSIGMALGGDKMVWYAADYDNQMVRVDPTTGKKTAYDFPSSNSDPKHMDSDSAGNLWTISGSYGRLVEIDPHTAKMTIIPLPTDTPGKALAADRAGNQIWFAQDDLELPPPLYASPRPAPNSAQPWVGVIGTFNPKTSKFETYPIPDADTPAWMLAVDTKHPNRVWWNTRSGRIGYTEAIE